MENVSSPVTEDGEGGEVGLPERLQDVVKLGKKKWMAYLEAAGMRLLLMHKPSQGNQDTSHLGYLKPERRSARSDPR